MTKTKLRIGLVFDDSLDRPDGVQQYIFRIAEEMTRRGHEVHFLTGETLRTDLTNIHSLAKNMKVKFNGNTMAIPLPTSKKKIKALLAELRLDILHIQAPYSPFMAGRVMQCAKGIPVVGTFHILPNSSLVIAANRVLSIINSKTDKLFSSMMAVSPPAADFARRIYGYDCEVVPNPIRISDFTLSVKATDRFTHIVFLGRLVPRKGAKQLLMAIDYLVKHKMFTGRFKVTVAGRGEQLAELKGLAASISGLVSIDFPGFIAEEDKATLLASADIIALPSVSGESFGISVIEALAAARGVVLAGNNPGYSSVLHAMPELLVDPENTADFAARLVELLEDGAKRQNISVRQKEYVKQFDIQIVGDQVERNYLRLCKNTSQSDIM